MSIIIHLCLRALPCGLPSALTHRAPLGRFPAHTLGLVHGAKAPSHLEVVVVVRVVPDHQLVETQLELRQSRDALEVEGGVGMKGQGERRLF